MNYSTLYMLVGENKIAFVEGACFDILTKEQQTAERHRLLNEVAFNPHSIYEVKDGTVLNFGVLKETLL